MAVVAEEQECQGRGLGEGGAGRLAGLRVARQSGEQQVKARVVVEVVLPRQLALSIAEVCPRRLLLMQRSVFARFRTLLPSTTRLDWTYPFL